MPPEQSYGARGLPKSDHDVMGAQLVSNMTDRQELAKLVRKVGDYDLGSWSKTTGL